MTDKNLIEVQVDRIVTSTSMAVLVDDGDQQVWPPMSQVETMEEQPDGTVILEIPEWLANDKGLI